MSPKNLSPKSRVVIAWMLVVGISAIFLFSVFRHISYPLLWNDEAETAEYARRILKYGYPKMHDGNKLLFLWEQGPMEIGAKEPFDAYIISGWGQYYFAAIPAFFAKFADDIYVKTAIMRIPFALAGCAGLALMLLGLLQSFPNRPQLLWAAALFVLLCLLSISLTLHLREVRYYSLVILFSSCTFWIYWRFVICQRIGYWKYVSFLPLGLLGNLIAFYPVFIILAVTLLLHLLSLKLRERTKDSIVHLLRNASPIFLSLAISVPYFIFFETFGTSAAISNYWTFDNRLYLKNFGAFLSFFLKYEFLLAGILFRLVYFWVRTSVHATSEEGWRNKSQISNFLSLYFIVYLVFIARSPQYFERYAIGLIPVLAAIIVLDLFACVDLLGPTFSCRIGYCVAILLVVMGLGVYRQRDHYAGHLYELRYPYRGPMDFVIEFLQERFPNSEKLIVATNYEEPVYLFYLDARVIFGFAQQELEADMQLRPDVIIFRRGWWQDPQNYVKLLTQHKYEAVALPVADYPVNNLPELSFSIPHLYRTNENPKDNEAVYVFLRK